MRPAGRGLALALVLASVVGCNDRGSGPAPSAAPPASPSTQARPTTEDPLRARVPAALRERGTLVVRVDPSVAPLALRNENGTGHRGAEVEMAEAVAARWGLAVTYRDVGPGDLAGDLRADVDLVIGGLLITPETREGVTYVATLTSGVAWAMRRGRSEGLSPGGLCGRSVAVEDGTWTATVEVARRRHSCDRRGNPLRVQTYPGQDQATAALVSGKVDALAAPGPVIDDLVSRAGDSTERLGREYFVRRMGIAVRDDKVLPALLAATLIELRRDGTYGQILGRWGLAERDGVISVVR